MGSQECAHRFVRIRGGQLSAYGVIQTLTITNIRIIAQIVSKAHLELHLEVILYFKENFYLCTIRKEILRNILKKIAFLLLDPPLNSGQIVNIPETTCMSACVLRGRDSVVRILAVQSLVGITWIRPRFLCILSYRYPVSHLSAL
jgi:hypothetical protein